MDEILATLAAAGISAYGSSVTALDAYFGRKPAPLRFYLALCSLQDLARAFEGLEYPGLPYADAALGPGRGAGEGACFRCADSLAEAEAAAFAPLDLLAEGRPGYFQDPKDAYPKLRERRLEPRPAPAELQYFEAAALLGRYDYELGPAALPAPPRDFRARAQRDLLSLVLTGPRPEAALGLLLETGFVAAYWPELAALSGLGQSKEYHPEGDAWAHTMETFRHRKLPSLTLSLALLLHDAGKPAAESAEGRRFDRHAEIGRALAERFLRRLGFAPALVEDVSFLVRYHMLPAALPRLPANRLEGLIDDARFPLLLELYKCDELSTFRGPDGYYE
ncbi:MAG TPA: HD domain-containing protein, partial [Spirochaetia bacterium]|nr:HD domain-containing protein [Spirochaetia bacterium]